ncbi:hypothetical protein ABIE26_001053 [Pedobacter africanus]|uniref:Uncharacterized protein n=1 Tax=Pedobacter africanus TaxID=151894 RepID=A0ACC6KTI3_9SPHI|nr:hypothetical protein [Pedobacter africanus]MDR6782459.1 hypothetical protein [Pedobacter africanus]
MKNKSLFISLPILVLLYISCNKISENVERDIIFKDSVFFDIPVLSSITDPYTLPDLQSAVSIGDQINNQVKGFTTDHIKQIKITSLNMLLGITEKDKNGRDSIDTQNNFGNLETVKWEITNGADTNLVGSASVSSTGVLSTLAIPLSIPPEILKPYLIGDTKKYRVIVKAKKATSKPMKVKTMAIYTVTLAK